MRLSDVLADHDASRTALAAPSATWSFAELAQAWRQPVLRAASRHGGVALRLRDPARLAIAIAGLDGRVERLFLLSHDTPPDVARALIARGGATVLVTDGSGLEGPETLVWTAPLEPSAEPAGDDSGDDSGDVETQWLLATSGTTGTPKLVGHTLASLTRTASRARSVEALNWGLLYNICRFAGAQVLLQSLMSGATLISPDPDASLEDRLAYLAEKGATALSATPTMWRKILMTSASERLDLRQITLGGEIVDDAVLSALAARYPDARIVHIYASTEAGAAFSVSDGRAGFPRSFLAEPPKGIELKIDGGRLRVRTGRANAGYVGLDESFADAEGFVDTGDAVEVRGDRCLFLGRANGVINVGGNKLFPEEVEGVLLAHPAVRLARVSAKKSPITGQLVVAEIVPAEGAPASPAVNELLLAHCRARLEPWKTPALVRIVSDLAPNAGGKLERARA